MFFQLYSCLKFLHGMVWFINIKIYIYKFTVLKTTLKCMILYINSLYLYQPHITILISKRSIVTSLLCCDLPAWERHPETSVSLLWGSSECNTQRKARERRRRRGERAPVLPLSRLEPRSDTHWPFLAPLSCPCSQNRPYLYQTLITVAIGYSSSHVVTLSSWSGPSVPTMDDSTRSTSEKNEGNTIVSFETYSFNWVFVFKCYVIITFHLKQSINECSECKIHQHMLESRV